MLLAIQILDYILDFFKNLGEFVVESAIDGVQPTDLFLALAGGGFIIYVIAAWIRSNKSYEVKLLKSIDGMNNYFYKNPVVNNENLKEFNNRMKNVPKPVRTQWQNYILNKGQEPSKYLTVENCIERPLRYTSYKHSVRNISIAFNAYMIVLLLVVAGGIMFKNATAEVGIALFNCLAVPAIIFFLKFIFKIILNIRYSIIVDDMYNSFGVFQRGIDKAVVGLPNYIDYEMLFTKKEIKENIPILQDYIERRERAEKEALEKAKNSEVEHEAFDFKAVGLSASLLLERAMRESETYTNNKKRIMYRISQKKQQLEDYKKNYEDLNREQIKQQQLSKENLERLRQNAESSANRVEASRIAKQQEEELKRQEQLEKDAQLAYEKYIKQKDVIDEEIKALEAELEEKRKLVEDIMMAEFKSYTSKLYDSVNKENEAKYNAIISEMQTDNDILADEVKDKILILEQYGIESKPTLKYEAKLEKDKIKEAEREKEQEALNAKRLEEAVAVKERVDSEELNGEPAVAVDNQTADEVNEEIAVNDANVTGENQEKQATNNQDANAKNENQEDNKQIDEEKLKQDLKSEITDEINGDKIKEELRNQLRDELKEELKEQINQVKEENKYDAYGGYYDAYGNYIYRDGSYYDAQGNFFDAEGRLLVPADQNSNEQGQIDNYGAYYDENGNYVYSDGSYYDAQGNFYDENGNYVPLDNLENPYSSGSGNTYQENEQVTDMGNDKDSQNVNDDENN